MAEGDSLGTAAARGAEDVADKKSLSKNVMQMKFMQKGVIIRLNEKEEMEKRIKRSKEHWVLGSSADTPKEFPYRFDTSSVVCEDLLPIGRMAFKNFNPPVDKIHKQLLRKAKRKGTVIDVDDDDDDENAEDLSDEEMADRYETLVQTIDNKFQGKRKAADSDMSMSDNESDDDIRELNKRAKRGFLKPSY